MKAGRPKKIRSRPLSGVGGPMNDAQRDDVTSALLEAYDDKPPEGLLDRIEVAFAAYKAGVEGLSQSVGKKAELEDATAITKDCRAVLERLPAIVDDLACYPRDLALRLRERLVYFPPSVDLQLFTSGADLWPALERLRAMLHRPRSWSTYHESLAADLLTVADACERSPAPPTRTKPPATARDRFVRELRELLGGVDLLESVVHDVLEALGVKAPQRL
jgi:hypothetical protein